MDKIEDVQARLRNVQVQIVLAKVEKKAPQ
jgi:hypothetical protein